MTFSDKTIKNGFILAGMMNLSVLIFSRLFTNETIAQYDPEVMSNFGLVMIILWGLAYISVAKNYIEVKWLIAVFALEKIIYVIIWVLWLLDNDLSQVFADDLMAGLFYSVYGVNDAIFFLFFTLVFFKLLRKG